MTVAQNILHRAFLESARPHILNITNHGIHQWSIIPGLTDTGGQNVFVNQLSKELSAKGYRVTILNRGGYNHPVTGEPRRGLDYYNEHLRIAYLNDGLPEFVRKEDMADRIPALTTALEEFLAADGSPVDWIISHYWDALALGAAYNRRRPTPAPHIWAPHSLGAFKKRHVSAEQWNDLRIDERIGIEMRLLPEVDCVAVTSSLLKESLRADYGDHRPVLWLPPCIDVSRFHPRRVTDEDPLWQLLGETAGRPAAEMQEARIVTEISRTVPSKRKDILIKAFARVSDRFPDAMLAVTIDPAEKKLFAALNDLIDTLGLRGRVAVLGSIWDVLPSLYAVTAIYCTPSVVEGFGMTAQEAAASRAPVIASSKVPFAVEFLLGETFDRSESGIQVGEGAIVVPADDVGGFAQALALLLEDEALRVKMAQLAYQITIPAFTWPAIVERFLADARRIVSR